MAAERGYSIEYVDQLKFSVSRGDKRIYLPRLHVIGSEDDAVLIEGGLDHELMHVDQTDPELRLTDRILHRLWNVIEDPRGEKGFFEKFPGCARNIERTLDLLAERGCFGVPSESQPFHVLCAFLLYELRAGVLGQRSFCETSRAPTAALARRIFGAIADQCLEIARDVVLNERGRQGSYRAVEAASQILEVLKGATPPQNSAPQASGSPEAPSQEDGEASDGPEGASHDGGSYEKSYPGEGEATPGDADSPVTDHGESATGSADEGESDAATRTGQMQGGTDPAPQSLSHDVEGCASGDRGDPSGAEQEPGSSESGSGSSVGQTSSDTSPRGSPLTPEQAQAARQAFDDAQSSDGPFGQGLEEQILGRHGLNLTGESPVYHEHVIGELINGREGVTPSSELRLQNLTRSNNVALALSLRLEDLLIAQGTTEVRYARSGRFDQGRVVKAACGNRRIYTRKSQSEDINTAFVLLTDQSGSMVGPRMTKEERMAYRSRSGEMPPPSRMDMANCSALAMGCSLDKFDVPFAIISFHEHCVLQHDFEDAWTRTLGCYDVTAKGTTNMGDAYFHAARLLMRREENRRIILLVTDGKPANWEVLRLSIQEAKRWGVETRTVLIAPTQDDFNRFEQLETAPSVAIRPAEIPRAIFKTLETVLVT